MSSPLAQEYPQLARDFIFLGHPQETHWYIGPHGLWTNGQGTEIRSVEVRSWFAGRTMKRLLEQDHYGANMTSI